MPETRYVPSSITLGLLLALGCVAGSDSGFRAKPATAYAHQASDQVTVGAKAFSNAEETDDAFGKKNNLLKYRVLPVLVVIENKRGKTIDLSHLEIYLVASDGRHATAVNPDDIPYLASGKHPSARQVPSPFPLPKKKNPLQSSDITSRAFAAKMLPPGDSASGFFYFEAAPESGDRLYLNGISETGTGREITYFEFSLEGK